MGLCLLKRTIFTTEGTEEHGGKLNPSSLCVSSVFSVVDDFDLRRPSRTSVLDLFLDGAVSLIDGGIGEGSGSGIGIGDGDAAELLPSNHIGALLER